MNSSVAIIVPVYNQERYLEKCIDSILNQTYSDYECILVDDGSTDKSPEICDRYAEKDNRVRVIHKHNEGVSAARKDGYKLASSEYICFLDSDDFLANDFIKLTIEKMIETDVDVCSCGHYQYLDGEVISKTYDFPDIVIDKSQILDEYLLPIIGKIYSEGYKNYPGYIWGKMYKKSLISDECFPSERDFFPEDDLFHLYISPKIQKAAFISDKLVYYRVNEISFTHSYRKDIWRMCKNRHERVAEFFADTNEKKVRERITASGFFSVYVTLRNAYELDDYSKFKDEIIEMLNDSAYKHIIKEIDFGLLRPRQKMMVILLKLKSLWLLYNFRTRLFRN
ncbi:glycosyltransferase family 2 protein [Lachnospiraceae bacterium C1.1]|nr:glycosyltransferase family 2 protein [Lachnospiraceae bacterium C1.1]